MNKQPVQDGFGGAHEFSQRRSADRYNLLERTQDPHRQRLSSMLAAFCLRRELAKLKLSNATHRFVTCLSNGLSRPFTTNRRVTFAFASDGDLQSRLSKPVLQLRTFVGELKEVDLDGEYDGTPR